MQTSIAHTINLIAGHPTRIGYHYLALAVSIALRDGYPARGLTTVLYPQIAVVAESTPTNVSRDIARAVDDCWDHGDGKELERITGRHLAEKPTPGEVIYYLLQHLTD